MKPFIVAINAISGGGKTTITKELQKRLDKSKALYFDDRNYDADSGIEDTVKWIEAGADVDLWDLERLVDDIETSMQENLKFIIMDYPFGYRQKQIAPFINYSVYIDTPLDIAMARRILRDYNNENIISIFDDMKHYLDRGRNAYLHDLNIIKESADFLVDGNLPISEIVDCVYRRVIEIKDINNH